MRRKHITTSSREEPEFIQVVDEKREQQDGDVHTHVRFFNEESVFVYFVEKRVGLTLKHSATQQVNKQCPSPANPKNRVSTEFRARFLETNWQK
jgi:hypothetical protein